MCSLWDMNNMILSLFSRDNRSITNISKSLSIAEVDSSSISTEGFLTKMRAKAINCF